MWRIYIVIYFTILIYRRAFCKMIVFTWSVNLDQELKSSVSKSAESYLIVYKKGNYSEGGKGCYPQVHVRI